MHSLWLAFLVAATVLEIQGAMPAKILTFDARPLQRLDLADAANARRVWDTLHLLAALQGLANREAPQLYLFYCREFSVDTDQFWFDWLRGEDGWLREAEIETVGDVEALVRGLRGAFDGLVVYDERVPATASAASTAAGCERLLPVRYDVATNSLFLRLTRDLALPVRLWLVNADGSPRFTGGGRLPDGDLPWSGSAKADVYRWAPTARPGPTARTTSTPTGSSARGTPVRITTPSRITTGSSAGGRSSSICRRGAMKRPWTSRASRSVRTKRVCWKSSAASTSGPGVAS
jgi:hypothetical protein